MMKRMLAFLMALVCFCGMITVSHAEEAQSSFHKKYDFDQSNDRNMADAMLLLRHVDGFDDGYIADLEGDLNKDGKVTVYDAVRFLQILSAGDIDTVGGLKVVSYNIKCGWYNKTISQVAEQLKEVDADLVGLQEVDCCTSRSGKAINQVKKIAEKAGYPYYAFVPVIDLTGAKNVKAPADLTQNAYGHGILSKYPISKYEIIWPAAQVESADEEVRCFGRYEIDVDGEIVAFYNCHLNTNLGRLQYEEIQRDYMSKDKYAICVGDFNETYDEFGSYFDNETFYNFSFGEDGTTLAMRINSKGEVAQVIDHIIVSRKSMIWKADEVQNGYYVREHEGASDHNMIYAYVELLEERVQ